MDLAWDVWLSRRNGPCFCLQAPRPPARVSLYNFPVSVCLLVRLSVSVSFCLGLSLSLCLSVSVFFSVCVCLNLSVSPLPHAPRSNVSRIRLCFQEMPPRLLPNSTASAPAPPASVLTTQRFWPKEHLCLPMAPAEPRPPGHPWGGDGGGFGSWP